MADSLTSPLSTELYSARPPIRVSETLASPFSVQGANRTAARTALDSHVAAWKWFHSACCCGVSSPAQAWACSGMILLDLMLQADQVKLRKLSQYHVQGCTLPQKYVLLVYGVSSPAQTWADDSAV